MTLRLATIDDHTEILRLMSQFHEESPHKEFSAFDWETSAELITTYLVAPKTEKIVILAETDDRIFGIIAGAIVPIFFNKNDKRAYEIVWYVEPQYHKTRDALRLLGAYEYWAAKMGCQTVSSATMGHNEKLSRYYTKKGYTLLEESYVKRLNHGY